MMKAPNANGSDGFLTAPDGCPDGWEFCKCLITPNVDGLTGKTPPGSPLHDPPRPARHLDAHSNPGTRALDGRASQAQLALRIAFGGGGPNLVQPSPTKSNHPLPHPGRQNHGSSLKFGIWSSGAWCLVLGASLLASAITSSQ